MFHPKHRLTGDFVSALRDLIPFPGLSAHQVAAAAHPETHTKRLAAKRRPSRQALERKANVQLSEPDSNKD